MSNNIDYEKEINKYFEKIVKAFADQCDYTLPIVYGQGHINDTYYTQIKYNENQGTKLILQRINHNIFTNPPKLMENIYGVTEFLKKRIALHGGDVMRETLTVIKTKDFKNYYQDDEGYYWRAYIFIDNATTYQEVKTIDDFQACGRAFGEFQKQLAQYPANLLFESIKDFHNTKKRFNDLLQAIEENKADRKHLVEKEITFALKRKDDACEIVNMLENNIIPLRVTHNDTKLNNIMIDDNTSKAICVIDLDTIMPGAACYDFGDSIRFGASSGAEDEKDLEKIYLDLNLFEAFSKGYLSSAKEFLSQQELYSLSIGAKIMTFECGIRFLSDFLNGDTYFKVHYENHNLDRCRTQFKLVEDMELKMEQMQMIIKKYS